MFARLHNADDSSIRGDPHGQMMCEGVRQLNRNGAGTEHRRPLIVLGLLGFDAAQKATNTDRP
jgi:hypothetical protein